MPPTRRTISGDRSQAAAPPPVPPDPLEGVAFGRQAAQGMPEEVSDEDLYVRPQSSLNIGMPDSRGDPADGANAVFADAFDLNDPEFLDPDTGLPFTRRSGVDGINELEIREELKRPGWAYKWDAYKVGGQDADAQAVVATYEGGWRPCTATSDPAIYRQMCPPGYKAELIERGGLRLFRRPMPLEVEAKREMEALAHRQERSKLIGAQAMPEGIADKNKVKWGRLEFQVQRDSVEYERPAKGR